MLVPEYIGIRVDSQSRYDGNRVDLVLDICSKTGIEGLYTLNHNRLRDRHMQLTEIELDIRYNETVSFVAHPKWIIAFEDPPFSPRGLVVNPLTGREEYRLRFLDERLEDRMRRIKILNDEPQESESSDGEA